MHDLIINLAPTGMIPTKDKTPYVPITPKEIVDEVLLCAELGVSIVHLHARDEYGIPTTDEKIFAEIITKIRDQNPALIITTTTSGRRVSDVNERAKCLMLAPDLRPDMASLTLSSMNFSTEASVNSPSTIMRLAEIMLQRDIRPELEVFDLGMINFAKILIDKGLLKPPYYFNILLGNPSSAQASLMHLGVLVNELPVDSVWAVAGIGRFQKTANALGVVMADGVRLGLEDNLWLDDDRTQLASNVQLVERVKAQAAAFGRTIASPVAVRQRLQLKAW
jgi:3-keto-5-aminohexanoate cleavage enzyme